MNYPFNVKPSLSRKISIAVSSALIVTALSGCSLLPTRTTEPSTEPSSEPPIVTEESFVPQTEPSTEAPTTEATEPPTEEVKKENVAIVKEQLNMRSSPSTGSRVISTLDAGDEVEVLRLEKIGEVKWAFVHSDTIKNNGWITTDMLDMSNVTLESGSTATPANTEATNPPETAPTSGPVDSVTGTGTSATPANSRTGTVNTNTLNIRSSASTNGERVGAYTYGDKITILETNNGWGRTNKGWVSLNYVTLDQTTSAPTNNGTGTRGTVTGSNVNVRSGAGTNYGVVSSLRQGDVVTVTETVSVGNTQWGKISQGWICLDYVRLGSSVPSNAGTTTGGSGTATVTGSGLNVRSGAGTNYEIVGTLSQGQTVTILETITNGASQWGRTTNGWICLDYVRMN